jgi:hypothetical protein
VRLLIRTRLRVVSTDSHDSTKTERKWISENMTHSSLAGVVYLWSFHGLRTDSLGKVLGVEFDLPVNSQNNCLEHFGLARHQVICVLPCTFNQHLHALVGGIQQIPNDGTPRRSDGLALQAFEQALLVMWPMSRPVSNDSVDPCPLCVLTRDALYPTVLPLDLSIISINKSSALLIFHVHGHCARGVHSYVTY